MREHKMLSAGHHQICKWCGIALTPETQNLSCPPWGRQSEGGIPQSGSQLEAGVLKELRAINALMERAREHLIYDQNTKITDSYKFTIWAMHRLRQLILKLEGQTKK